MELNPHLIGKSNCLASHTQPAGCVREACFRVCLAQEWLPSRADLDLQPNLCQIGLASQNMRRDHPPPLNRSHTSRVSLVGPA